jgi:hypothetical protein
MLARAAARLVPRLVTASALPSRLAPALNTRSMSALITPRPLLHVPPPSTVALLFKRPIITIDVYQPAEHGMHGSASSRLALQADVARAEEIALAQFNRLVQGEVQRGTLRPGPRRMKRFARYLQPTLRRRDNRARGAFADSLEFDRHPASSLATYPRALPVCPRSPCGEMASEQAAARKVHELDPVPEETVAGMRLCVERGVVLSAEDAHDSHALRRAALSTVSSVCV